MSRKRYSGIRVSPERAERFWAKVQNAKVRGCCWLWQGFKRASGHGVTSLKEYTGNMSPMHAHKVAWLLVRGEIAAGLCVNHKCHNAACCNPEHMYLGTRAENMADRFQKRQRVYRVSKAKASCSEPDIMRGGN